MKYTRLTDDLFDYLCANRSDADDPVLEKLREETAKLGLDAIMQISPEQGSFLTVLTKLLNVRSAIEIGTFTGYSSICIARGLPNDGRLICVDANEEWTAVAKRYWERDGLSGRIELRIGEAVTVLEQLDSSQTFDLAFVDAYKPDYPRYYERLLPLVRQNGVIIFDNMLWGGSVLETPPSEASVEAVQTLNNTLTNDDRVESVLLPVADGIRLCRKR
ncbi:MAG: SAM-dependent methyltransferase [Verrucomicrobiales bacterium]|nr:SAM-dependent methyltransferase [Verrucomicrobiales bacterium]|tara:strand:- start:3948 stop:4601 length:654 start_codon:yes stop_codon:yes gene_type:complete